MELRRVGTALLVGLLLFGLGGGIFETSAQTPPDITPIYAVQGSNATSALAPGVLTVEGVVTAIKNNGFFVQDPVGDNDPNTSDGIFIFTSRPPTVTLGNRVRALGNVSEYRRANTQDATLTQIESSRITDLGKGQAPTPVRLSLSAKPGTRQIPAKLASTPAFDPDVDALDFYETLEGMLVEIENATAVGPTSVFGAGGSGENSEIPVVADNGDGLASRTSRGGVIISETNYNPQRLILNDWHSRTTEQRKLPLVAVGARFPGTLTGVLDYTFSNYKLQVYRLPEPDNSRTVTVTILPALSNPEQIRVASYNIENFTRRDAQKVQTIAGHIGTQLGYPDILTLVEVQDDNGATDDGTLDAGQNLAALTDAIKAKNGPAYNYVTINPANNQDGGEPGGNIRVVILYRSDRGVTFTPVQGGTATTPLSIGEGGRLSFNPGRIDPLNPAFRDSRKPLVAEFGFRGQRIIVIGNHLISKGGDAPLFGSQQPPVLSSERTRNEQAAAIRKFVSELQDKDPAAHIVVAGDLNDFEFSRPLKILKNDEGKLAANKTLVALVENSALAQERYTYNFQGNSQALDHLVYSQNLAGRIAKVTIARINADFPRGFPNRVSDHDAVIADFDFTPGFVPVQGGQGVTAPATGVGKQATETGSELMELVALVILLALMGGAVGGLIFLRRSRDKNG
jgi:uncharacterized protein